MVCLITCFQVISSNGYCTIIAHSPMLLFTPIHGIIFVLSFPYWATRKGVYNNDKYYSILNNFYHSKYNCLLYLQVARQQVIKTTSTKKGLRTGNTQALFFVYNNDVIYFYPFMIILYHRFIHLYHVYIFSHKVLHFTTYSPLKIINWWR